MKTVVAFESMYGNTRQVAEAIAEGLKAWGDVEVVSVHEAKTSSGTPTCSSSAAPPTCMG